jgi:tRNA(Ile)-lysidine synthase
MTTVIAALTAGLGAIPVATPLCVGLSGGLDSMVLLHALVHLTPPRPVRALHVNHHLSQSADQWQQRCQDYCASLKVGFTAKSVDVNSALTAAGSGIEAAARSLRYKAFEENLKQHETLLLAHHLDDQLETLLLRLMRGASVQGLSAIPVSRALGSEQLLRPLLPLTRRELVDYAQANELAWVEDDSNLDISFDRNYCRHSVLPVLAKRWPNYRESWSKSLQLISEAADIVDSVATQDIDQAISGHPGILNIRVLTALPEPRQRSALRHWLARIAAPELGWKPLNDLIQKLKTHQGSAQTLSQSGNFQLMAYQDELHGLRRLENPQWPQRSWSMARESTFVLPANGELILHPDSDLNEWLANLGEVSIRYRQGGEHFKPRGRPTKSLKQVLQETAVPPWLRDRLPLIYSGESLVFIPTVGASEAFDWSGLGQPASVNIVWRQPSFNWFE